MGKISLIYGKVPISSQTTLLNFNYNLLNSLKFLTQFCFVPYPGVKICTILPVFQYHMTYLKAMLHVHTQGNFSCNLHFEVLQVKCFFQLATQCLLHWKLQNKNCQVTWPWRLTPRVKPVIPCIEAKIIYSISLFQFSEFTKELSIVAVRGWKASPLSDHEPSSCLLIQIVQCTAYLSVHISCTHVLLSRVTHCRSWVSCPRTHSQGLEHCAYNPIWVLCSQDHGTHSFKYITLNMLMMLHPNFRQLNLLIKK